MKRQDDNDYDDDVDNVNDDVVVDVADVVDDGDGDDDDDDYVFIVLDGMTTMITIMMMTMMMIMMMMMMIRIRMTGVMIINHYYMPVAWHTVYQDERDGGVLAILFRTQKTQKPGTVIYVESELEWLFIILMLH